MTSCGCDLPHLLQPLGGLHLAREAPEAALEAVVPVGARGEEAGVDDRLAEGAAEDGAAANLLSETTIEFCHIFKTDKLYTGRGI